MRALLAAGLLLLLPGCSTVLDARDMAERPCAFPIAESGILMWGCDLPESRRDHWRTWVPRAISVYDEHLAAWGLPPMSEAASGYEIYFYKREPGGRYAGFYRQSLGRIELIPATEYEHWWRTALTHELWHLYEHEVFGLTEQEWSDMQRSENPRHFLTGKFSDIHVQVRDDALSREWP